MSKIIGEEKGKHTIIGLTQSDRFHLYIDSDLLISNYSVIVK